MYKQATELMLNFKDRILIKGEEDTGGDAANLLI